MAKAKFELEVGALYRRQVRNMLNNSKAKIEYNDPDAMVKITETKALIESRFIFVVTNCTDEVAFATKRWYNKMMREFA